MKRTGAASTALFAALLLAAGLAVPAVAKPPKKKPAATPTPTPAPEAAPPPAAAPPPPAPSDPVLERVDGKLCSYATGEARAELEPIAGRGDAGVRTALGRIYEQEKRYGDAERELRAAAAQAADDPAPLVYLGEALLHASRDGDAGAAFRQAAERANARLAANGGDAAAHYYLGVARQRLQQYGAAAESLQRARELRPGDAMTLYQLGATRAFQERWSEAVDLFDQALAKDSGIAYAYYYRGLSQGKLNRKDKLVNDLERFLALAANAPEAAAARRMVDAARR